MHQVLGLPAPPDFALVIPKYKPCNRGPWKLAGISYCRVIGRYDAVELRKASERAGLRVFADPQYHASMPLIGWHEVLATCSPRESLKAIVSSPSSSLGVMLVDILNKLKELGVSFRYLGVTGTLALGMEIEGLSDIDLVVYGAKAALAMLEAFPLIGGTGVRARIEWVKLRPSWSLGWRRRIIEGVQVSWIGAPEHIGEHCKPLRNWRHIAPPHHIGTILLTVPPGQEGALLYPPCVKSEEGLHIVSYEYNAALHLYRGGRLRVRGLISEDSVYLGTIEEPGYLEVL